LRKNKVCFVTIEQEEKMAVVNVKAEFTSDLKTVWDIVTSLAEYEWRSDISKIEVVEEGKRFIEYTKDGFSTEFCITAFEPYKRYEFDMHNGNMSGHWTGKFSAQGNIVTIDFTEDVTAKKAIMKPFVKGYLKKQQSQYIADLKKEVEKMK